MGSDLSLRNCHTPFEDHADWRSDRPVGGEEFAYLEPRLSKRFGDNHWEDGEWLFRPADFSAWRPALDDVNGPFKEIHADGWTETIADFHHMLDAMEAEPDLWGRYGH